MRDYENFIIIITIIIIMVLAMALQDLPNVACSTGLN